MEPASKSIGEPVFRRFGPFPEDLPYGEDSHVLYPASREVVWGYIPGAPVNYRQLGDNLSRPSPERAMAWMNKAERTALELGLTKRERTWTLSRQWVRTGRLMRDCGRYAEARDCYRRAIQHRPLFAAAYRRLLEELLRRS